VALAERTAKSQRITGSTILSSFSYCTPRNQPDQRQSSEMRRLQHDASARTSTPPKRATTASATDTPTRTDSNARRPAIHAKEARRRNEPKQSRSTTANMNAELRTVCDIFAFMPLKKAAGPSFLHEHRRAQEHSHTEHDPGNMTNTASGKHSSSYERRSPQQQPPERTAATADRLAHSNEAEENRMQNAHFQISLEISQVPRVSSFEACMRDFTTW
jgi:hypothetical protein